SAPTGVRAVSVTNPDGQSGSRPGAFLVASLNSAPAINDVNPKSGNQGQSAGVTLSGANFQNGATCNFGAGIVVKSCSWISSTQLTAAINISLSSPTGSHAVVITNPDGQQVSFTGFMVSAVPPPPGNATAHVDFNYADRNALLVAGWSYAAATGGAPRDTEQPAGSSLAVDYNQSIHPGVIR